MNRFATLRDALQHHAVNQPDALFVLSPETGRTMSYAALAAETNDLAKRLAKWGVAPGSHVGFLLHNGYQTAAIFIGTMAAGYVSVPLNLLSQPTQLAYVLTHSKVRVVFTSTHYESTLRAAVALLAPDVAATIRVEVIDSDAPSVAEEAANVVPAANAIAAEPLLQSGSPALLMYTSGTTGQPKGALLTHGNVTHAAQNVAAWHGLTAQDRVLSSLPLYHINGQCVATLAPFVSGGSIVAPHKFSASSWWGWVDSFHPTWINVVPTIIAYLLNAADGKASHYPSVRFARSASAPLPPEQHKAFEQRFNIGVIEAMGMTECASVVFCNPQNPSERKYGTPGLPCGVEARVASTDDGRVLKDNASGELQLRGDNVMLGYFNDPEKTREALIDGGWLRTGDIGHRDSDGFYLVTGRIKELIIKGGENIAPREIDEALLLHPAVLEAAAVGVPDVNYGQDILAAIILKPDAQCSADELREHCLLHLGKFKTPKEFRFVQELPKGPSGKVQRLKLLESWQDTPHEPEHN
ncbi:MAG: long-chain fatty acid--CoA ligase [Betaproteobacteria bacterium]|nr:MAG: long-chain fatty acid--CoA ligase [Betaproteobacteria bacterium]